MSVRSRMTAHRLLGFVNSSLQIPGLKSMAARVKGPLEGAIEDYTAYIKANGLDGLRFVTRDEVGSLTESALYKPITAA
eukprot:771572-Heterocapsa_arctica.AAC.1